MMTPRTRSFMLTMFFVPLTFGLTACTTLAPRTYQEPAAPQARQWQSPSTGEQSAPGTPFWQGFADTELNRLIDEVLQRNNDIRSATLNIRRARLAADLDRTDLFPHPSLNGSASRSRDLDQDDTSRSYGLSGGLNYEVDLWGRVADQYDSARLEVAALEEDRLTTMLSLVATTAQLYWQGGYLREILALDAQTIDYAEQSLAKVEAQFKVGAVSKIELLSSRQDVLTAHNTLTGHQNDWRQNRHALALLLDQEPQNDVAQPPSIAALALPGIAAGIPADVLSQRPDLRAAERRLRQSFIDMEITRKSIYPTLSLTGSLGYSSTRLRDLLDNPLATLAADLTLPLIDWNSSRLTIEQAQTDYELQAITFRQTLLTALQEVEDALSARRQSLEQDQRLTEALQLAHASEALYEQRYRCGETAEQTWLDSREQRRSSYRSWLENRLTLLNNTMTVYQTLGGPWPSMEGKTTKNDDEAKGRGTADHL
nr:TolC family protein [uncultured Desulfuromonas sp.]